MEAKWSAYAGQPSATTSALSLAAATVANAGSYDCVVTSPALEVSNQVLPF